MRKPGPFPAAGNGATAPPRPAVPARATLLAAAVCVAPHICLAVAPRAVPAGDGPALLCRGAIAAVESATHIPDAFLSAIGRVESGRPISATGGLAPWPWTVNAAGEGHFYASRQEAIDAVKDFQAHGIRSLDVGCLQVNLMYHPEAFGSLEQAFDPSVNATYAGRLLQALHDQFGSWPLAAAAYHSQTPQIGHAYEEKVLAEWGRPDDGRRASTLPSTARRPESPSVTAAIPERPPQPAALPAATRAGLVLPPPGRAGRTGGIAGRTLADYRAMPVRLAGAVLIR